MKKVLWGMMMFILMFFMAMPVYAVEDYTFDLQYTGEVVKNVQKDGYVILKAGKDSLPYSKVRVKIKIEGPATPVILARDSNNTQYNVAQLEYWGPQTGFPVNSATINVTPIQATYPEAGTYTTTLSLVDVSQEPEKVITTKQFTVHVYEEDEVPENNVIDNAVVDNNIANNTLGELPKTGTSVIEYAMYIIALTLIISIVGIYLNKKRMKA